MEDNKLIPETKEDKKQNVMEQDLFANDDFIYYKEISIQNKKNPETLTTYKFGLKEITGFEEDKISKNAMKFNAKTQKVDIEQQEANIQFLQAVVVEAPFRVTAENLRKLSKKVRDQLMNFAREINEVTSDTEKK